MVTPQQREALVTHIFQLERLIVNLRGDVLPSRELSIALTELETALLWLQKLSGGNGNVDQGY